MWRDGDGQAGRPLAMSSISSLIADSSSSRAFAGFFKRAVLSARAHPVKRERSPALGGFLGALGGGATQAAQCSQPNESNSRAPRPFRRSCRPLKIWPSVVEVADV